MNTDPKKLSWEQAEEIVKQFKKIQFIAPRLDALIPIGEDRIKKSIRSIVEPEFLEVVERKPAVYKGGFPFCVEVGIAFGGNAGKLAGKDEEGKDVKIGKPMLLGAKVSAEILEQGRDKKVNVIKYKPKVRYRRKAGHRQMFTKVKVVGI